MDGRIEEEGLKKQEENKILKTGMCARIDEWLKKKRKVPDEWYRMTWQH